MLHEKTPRRELRRAETSALLWDGSSRGRRGHLWAEPVTQTSQLRCPSTALLGEEPVIVALSPPGVHTLQSTGPVPAQGTHPSVHQPCPYRGHVPFSPPAPASPLGPGAPGSPGQPRRMDSLSEPSRPTSFTSAEKHGVGVRALVAGPTTGHPSRECLPQGDLVPRLRPVSLASDEGSAWQRASCLRRALVRWGGRAWAWNPPCPIPSRPLHAVCLWASHSTPLSSGHPNGDKNNAVGTIRSDNADAQIRGALHGILKEPRKQWILPLHDDNKYL